MRLTEIENPHGDLEALKAQVLQPGTIDVANANYSVGQVSLGSLQMIGAGKILRKMERNGIKHVGFQYFTDINGQPIQASIDLGNRILQPGDRFMDES